MYKELALRFAGNKNLVIAKWMLQLMNVAMGYDYTGFPTIYFSPAGGEKPILYDSARDVESFDAFLRKHATFSLGEEQPTEKDEL